MIAQADVESVRSLLDAGAVPDGQSGQVEVRRITITEEEANLARLRAMIHRTQTRTEAGTYVGLYRYGHLWMSDTPDERSDCDEVIERIVQAEAKTILINGLGLGMILNCVLRLPSVEDVQVVEIDPDVIALVGPTFMQLAAEEGKTLHIWEGDAYTITIPGVFDVVWHDVWADISADNLLEMTRLHRRYGRKAAWQQSWKRRELREHGW